MVVKYHKLINFVWNTAESLLLDLFTTMTKTFSLNVYSYRCY